VMGAMDWRSDSLTAWNPAGKVRSIVRCLKPNWKPPPNGLAAAASCVQTFIACVAGFLAALEAASLSHIGRTHGLATARSESTPGSEDSVSSSSDRQ
jgi:hypothetical protein